MKINCCPRCGSDQIGRGRVIRRWARGRDILPGVWWLECWRCHYKARRRLGLWMAEKAWNRREQDG